MQIVGRPEKLFGATETCLDAQPPPSLGGLLIIGRSVMCIDAGKLFIGQRGPQQAVRHEAVIPASPVFALEFVYISSAR